ncbi:MAG: AAA family ATPase [Actinomycetia bacterium]|nr:AAA family ATPase [Actinomycetes bacterium]
MTTPPPDFFGPADESAPELSGEHEHATDGPPPETTAATDTGAQQHAVSSPNWSTPTASPEASGYGQALPAQTAAANDPTSAQPASRPPSHQQPPTRQPSGLLADRPRRDAQHEPSERTAILSTSQIAALRAQGQDPGVGDFFDSSAEGATASPSWPAPNAQPQVSRFDSEFGAGGDPFAVGGRDDADRPSSQRSIELTGWRKAVNKATFGRIQPRPSAKQLSQHEQLRRITASLLDVYVVGFVSSKGGVGKTSMSVTAGNAIARNRGDRVIVVDVDTDLGDAESRFEDPGGPKANIEALAALHDAGSYANVRVFTTQNKDRLEILSSQNDPRSSYRLTGRDFDQAMSILRTHYNVILLDCGTSITSPLFPTIAKHLNCLVVVASNDRPGSRAAWKTLSWLQAHGFGRLLPRTVVVLNSTRGPSKASDVDLAESKFRGQGIDEVIAMPFDKHIDEGDFIAFDRMGKKTRKAAMALAGSIARYYPARHRHGRGDDLGSY